MVTTRRIVTEISIKVIFGKITDIKSHCVITFLDFCSVIFFYFFTRTPPEEPREVGTRFQRAFHHRILSDATRECVESRSFPCCSVYERIIMLVTEMLGKLRKLSNQGSRIIEKSIIDQ